MADAFSYEFLRDSNPDSICEQLGQRSSQGWEPVGFSIGSAGDYVVLVRKKIVEVKVEKTEDSGPDRFDNQDRGI